MNRWQRLYAIQGTGAAAWMVLGIVFLNTHEWAYLVLGTTIFIAFGALGWRSFFRGP